MTKSARFEQNWYDFPYSFTSLFSTSSIDWHSLDAFLVVTYNICTWNEHTHYTCRRLHLILFSRFSKCLGTPSTSYSSGVAVLLPCSQILWCFISSATNLHKIWESISTWCCILLYLSGTMLYLTLLHYRTLSLWDLPCSQLSHQRRTICRKCCFQFLTVWVEPFF